METLDDLISKHHIKVNLCNGAADGLTVRSASQAPVPLLFSVENMTRPVSACLNARSTAFLLHCFASNDANRTTPVLHGNHILYHYSTKYWAYWASAGGSHSYKNLTRGLNLFKIQPRHFNIHPKMHFTISCFPCCKPLHSLPYYSLPFADILSLCIGMSALLTCYPAGHLLSLLQEAEKRIRLETSLINRVGAVWCVLSSSDRCWCSQKPQDEDSEDQRRKMWVTELVFCEHRWVNHPAFPLELNMWHH